MNNRYLKQPGFVFALAILLSGSYLFGQSESERLAESASGQQADVENPRDAYASLRQNFFYMSDPRFQSAEAPDHLKAMLGVHVRQADATLRHHLNLTGEFGLVVEHVTVASAAEKAGLKLHDVLVKFEDQWLVNLNQLESLIAMHKPGETVAVQYFRNGKSSEIKVKLSKQTAAAVGAMGNELEKVHQDLLKNPHADSNGAWKLEDCKSCHKVSDGRSNDLRLDTAAKK